MSNEFWQRVDDIYHAALGLRPEARGAFLNGVCKEDVELRSEIESLLQFDGQSTRFLATPAIELEAKAIAEGSHQARTALPKDIGPYRMLSILGQGGMGQVYLALDTRLDRKVAIKFLSAELTADAERVLRFKHEARTTSSLNHPNIVTIHEIGETDGRQFIVNEYIEGETLRQHIAASTGKRLNFKEALSIANQIAHALDAAHQASIVHRDVKPENIIIRKDGLVKILDFGIAKLTTDSKVLSGQLSTRTGIVMGTAAYMSPEQARGQKVDHRTDIFSMGVILYEMLSGQKPFAGETASDVLAALLTSEPVSLTRVAPEIPIALRRIVQRCLEKSPEKRFQSAGDLAFALEEVGSLSGEVPTPSLHKSGVMDPLRQLSAKARLAWILVGVLVLSLLGLLAAFVYRNRPLNEMASVRFYVPPPENTVFVRPETFAISPDGRSLAITPQESSGKRQLWVRPLDSLTSQPLAGTEGATAPFWSPDSRSIAFFANGELKTVPAAGGTVNALCDISGVAFQNGTWNRDGIILFQREFELYRISASGGEATRLMSADQAQGKVLYAQPRFLPDGQHFLYAEANAQGSDNGVHVGSLDQPRGKLLVKADSNAGYSKGYLLFVRQGALMAQAFDPDRLQLSGDSFTIAERMAWPIELPTAVSSSQTGTLVYLNTPNLFSLVWYDRNGKRLGAVGPPAVYSNPALSPDEKRLAVDVRDLRTNTRDIWIFDLIHGTSSRFTFDPADDFGAVWSPDGSRIAFTSNRKGHRDLYQKTASGAGEDEPLYESADFKNVEDWSPGEQSLIYNQRDSAGTESLWILPLLGDRKTFQFLTAPFAEHQSQFSPDGHWLAYTSSESGRYEVYVREFPQGGRWQISTDTGQQPKWRRDGKELFYIAAGQRFMAVNVDTTSNNFVAGPPHPLFEKNMFIGGRNWYVVTGDGQRFLVRVLAEEMPPPSLTVVLNWTAGLKR